MIGEGHLRDTLLFALAKHVFALQLGPRAQGDIEAQLEAAVEQDQRYVLQEVPQSVRRNDPTGRQRAGRKLLSRPKPARCIVTSHTRPSLQLTAAAVLAPDCSEYLYDRPIRGVVLATWLVIFGPNLMALLKLLLGEPHFTARFPPAILTAAATTRAKIMRGIQQQTQRVRRNPRSSLPRTSCPPRPYRSPCPQLCHPSNLP